MSMTTSFNQESMIPGIKAATNKAAMEATNGLKFLEGAAELFSGSQPSSPDINSSFNR